ncbi:MAG: class I SAM-dependent methyltransferase [Pseudomonadales bacterium]
MQLFFHPSATDLAARWAERFDLVACDAPPANHRQHFLWAVDDHLELHAGADDRAWQGGVWIAAAEVERRATQGGDLVRACGVAHDFRPRVLDAMAGWGIDGLVLASRGCQVTMVERHPLVSALQQDLARRTGLADVCCRCGDGFRALEDDPGYDVVYLDPMFPQRGKGALPGKRLQVLAALAEADERPLALWLQTAVAVTRRRVVLKRRGKDPLVAPPDWQIRGRTVRFDVYRGRGGS